MKTPLQITYRNMSSTPSLEAAIREHVAELDGLYRNITSCRVVLEIPHRHHIQGRHFHVRVELRVPGDVLVVNRDPTMHDAHEDAYVAIRDAFRAARRELRDYAAKRQRKVKVHEPHTHRGHVSHLDFVKDYGFIKTHDGSEVYFHANSLRNKSFWDLHIGDEVAFAEEPGDKGPQAIYVAVRNEEQMPEADDAYLEFPSMP